MLLEKHKREVGHVFYLALDLLVKLDFTLNDEQLEEVASLLEQEAKGEENNAAAFLRAIVTYARQCKGD